MRSRTFVAVALLAFMLPRSPIAGPVSPPAGFALAIAAGESPNFVDQWTSTSYTHVVHVPRIHQLQRGKTAHVAFFLSGMACGVDGRSHVGVRVRIRGPDRSVNFADDHFARVSGPNSGRRGFVIADPTLTFILDTNDRLGPWVIEATARDSVGGATSSASYTIVAHK